MRHALLVLAALAAGGLVGADPPVGPPRPPQPPTPAHAARDTRCAFCHSVESWTRVTFDHDRTGFPLRGRHAATLCSGCHASSTDFRAALPTNCAACHTDVHAGEFGMRCASCHDAENWRSRFNADAHRFTNFPLTGRHGTIPCEECHLDQRDRGFTRATVSCFTCHQADYTRAAMISVDHAAAGFSTNCRDCHNTWSFRAGVFPAHNTCFLLTSGPHTGIACQDCHTSVPRAALITGACATNNAACTNCHTHNCATAAGQHTNVVGFQCKDRKCYECHRFTAAPASLAPHKGTTR